MTQSLIIFSDVSMSLNTFKISLLKVKAFYTAEHMNRTYSVFFIIILFTIINKFYDLQSKRAVKDVKLKLSAI